MMESVALEQTALSHILNAEGEKIQKAVACATDLCEVLKVNDSVNKTIMHIIQLEQVLLQKLESTKELVGTDLCCARKGGCICP